MIHTVQHASPDLPWWIVGASRLLPACEFLEPQKWSEARALTERAGREHVTVKRRASLEDACANSSLEHSLRAMSTSFIGQFVDDHRIDAESRPVTPDLLDWYLGACAATDKAMKIALEYGAAVHLGGGFHHAFPGRAEAMCLVNDVAYAIRRNAPGRVAIIDCDVHQGNGTAAFFRRSKSVFTASLHAGDLYPFEWVECSCGEEFSEAFEFCPQCDEPHEFRPHDESDIDTPLYAGCGNGEYLDHLERTLDAIESSVDPDLIVYVAGCDVFKDDRLGNLRLTQKGIYDRDRKVFKWARDLGIPIVAVTAGGYSEAAGALHAGTVDAADSVFK